MPQDNKPNMKPIAQSLASKGRYGDSMLVHMTPGEVAGLQYLAMRHGGSLTTNPETGLPESFFLAALLPALAGAAGSALLPAAFTTALGGMAVPAAVGGITALATGSMQAGLAAGMGAFGGAGLGSGLLAAGGAGTAAGGAGLGAGALAAGEAAALGSAAAGGAGAAGAAGALAPEIAAATAQSALPTATGTMSQLGAAQQITQPMLAAPGGIGGGFAGQGVMAPTGAAGMNLISPAAQATQAGAIQGSTGLIPGAPSFSGAPGVTQAAGGIGGLPGAGGGIGVSPQMQLAQQTGIQTADAAMSPLERMGSGITNLLKGEGDSRDRFMKTVGGPMGLASKTLSAATPFFAEEEESGPDAPQTYIRPYAFDFKGPETQEGFKYRTGKPGESTAEQRYFTPTFTSMGVFKAGTEPGGSFYGTPTAEQYALYSKPRKKDEYSSGGIASLRENDFILPADVISHMGNGSSDAGMEIAITKFKARPIKGDGDGMSDSIPTNIEGKQKALVANEEALIPREMVAFLGGGSVERGAEKLEKFMDRVRKARTGKKKQAPEIDVGRYMPA